MRGKRVRWLRNVVRYSNLLKPESAPEVTLKQLKKNHQGSRKTFTKPATATGYFCSRPAARHRKAMIAAKHERMVKSDI